MASLFINGVNFTNAYFYYFQIFFIVGLVMGHIIQKSEELSRRVWVDILNSWSSQSTTRVIHTNTETVIYKILC